jgi:ATP-dependent DNA helicase DinG
MDNDDPNRPAESKTMQAAADCLGTGSNVAKALPGFKPRPQQQEMAAAVEEAVAEGRHLVVEAGTGVGKSFAYLVPILLHIQRGGGPIVVATRTIALQEQLVEKDIPFLKKTLGLKGLQVALAKGRGNYVCRRRLEMALAEGPGLFDDPAERTQLERLEAWAEKSRDGSRADLPFRPLPRVWEVAQAEAGNCLQQRCPFFESCAYQRSKRKLYTASLVVANHALIFADLALREAGVNVLPDYECLVLDEAHEVEEGASENFGIYLSPIGIARLLGRFMGRKRDSGLFGRAEVSQDLYERLDETRGALRKFFDGVDRVRGDASELRLREAGLYGNPLHEPLGRLVAALEERLRSIEDPGLALEWRSRTARLNETRDVVALVHGLLDPDLVYWAERAGRRGYSVLRAAPVDVAAVLRRSLFRKVKSVILTSATLQVGGSFDHFNRRLGLEEPVEVPLGSPFDFRRQCRLLLHPQMPDPRERSYDEEVAERVRRLVLESGGGAFVLFTSYRSLARVHDALREEFEEAGLKVLRQGGDERTRDIMRAFQEREDCVLFATDTFWQGVDVRGRNLRLVVLTRLPFAVPDHPLQQARIERIEDDGGDAFRELSLPQAVLKLRQGFGRLIRTREDTGAVAILDPRVRTKNYGSIFLRSLPGCAVDELP